jgi:hypothetical protein
MEDLQSLLEEFLLHAKLHESGTGPPATLSSTCHCSSQMPSFAPSQTAYRLPTADGTSSSPKTLANALIARHPVQCPGASSFRPNR